MMDSFSLRMYFEDDGDAEDPADDETNSPATLEQLNKRLSRNSSDMQAIFAQLTLICRLNKKLIIEV